MISFAIAFQSTDLKNFQNGISNKDLTERTQKQTLITDELPLSVMLVHFFITACIFNNFHLVKLIIMICKEGRKHLSKYGGGLKTVGVHGRMCKHCSMHLGGL